LKEKSHHTEYLKNGYAEKIETLMSWLQESKDEREKILRQNVQQQREIDSLRLTLDKASTENNDSRLKTSI
jgi:hypothetical protein